MSSAHNGVYRRFLGYVKPYWSGFLFAVFGFACVASTEAGLAWLMKPMLDGSFVDKDPQVIQWVPLALLGIFVARGIGTFISSYCMTWVARNVVRDLRNLMFEHLLRLPSSFFDLHPSGYLTSKLIYDVEQVANSASNAITVIVRDSLTIVGLLALMFYHSWQLSLLFVVLAPVITVIVVYISKRFRRISLHIQRSMGNVSQLAQQIVQGQKIVKIFGGSRQEAEAFVSANEFNRRQHMKMNLTSSASVPISQFFAAIAMALVLYLATNRQFVDTISVGTFMSFLTAAMLLLAPLKRLTGVTANFQKGIAASQSIFELLDEQPEQDSGKIELQRARGRIEYKNVVFRYRDDRHPALRNINLVIEPGKTVAIVGRSGSGKSTLVNLLPRFYLPHSGTIRIDDHDLNDIRLTDLRRQIALVSQDVTLFNDTVANNIAYGSQQQCTEEDIICAANMAHAMEFIKDLPQGIHTQIGEKGTLISGGQRQRIAIARALLKDAPILILDEATSALDTESERLIQTALEELMKGRTTLVIAHRLSTIEKADTIVVMDGGVIIEQGNHKQLIAKNGQYAALHRMQFRDVEEAV